MFEEETEKEIQKDVERLTNELIEIKLNKTHSHLFRILNLLLKLKDNFVKFSFK